VRARALAGTALLSVAVAVPAHPATAAPLPTECKIKVGGQLPGTWPQQRLGFQQAWSVDRGQGVVVAVIDSGLDPRHPQLQHVRRLPGLDVIAGFSRTDTRDCYGHGTAVTSIIAAQPSSDTAFAGVAPEATILPIKQTNTQGDRTGTADGLAAAIIAAADRHADVANISVTVTAPTPALDAAMRRAAADNLVIVAAAGNDGQGTNLPAYPAAYSTTYPNVIAVSATDAGDTVGQFADTGRYVTVAAPGVDVPAAAPLRGYLKLSGTSFATPFVTGTVALLLAAHPGLRAAAVRNRLTATADTPPATVPDSKYGYGVVNPYLAVTAVRDDTAAPAPARPAAPLPAPVPPAAADRHLQHVALAAAVSLIGLLVLAAAAAAVLRGMRRGRPGQAS
jgi:membrane-anchored mycosin MYCP